MWRSKYVPVEFLPVSRNSPLMFSLQTQKRMTLLSNEDNKEISLSSELSQASTEKVNIIILKKMNFVFEEKIFSGSVGVVKSIHVARW